MSFLAQNTSESIARRGRPDKTSRRDEVVRDPSRDDDTFWAETESRRDPRRTVTRPRPDRDVEHYVRGETETLVGPTS